MQIWFLSPSIIRYGELQEITEAALAAGLLAPETSDPWRLRIVAKKVEKQPFDFSGAPGDEQYPDLALRALGVELERRLRILARRNGFTRSVIGSKRLLRHLLRSGTLAPQEYNVLRDLAAILDRAAKGAVTETGAAEWAADIGFRLLVAVEQHPIPPDLSEFGL